VHRSLQHHLRYAICGSLTAIVIVVACLRIERTRWSQRSRFSSAMSQRREASGGEGEARVVKAYRKRREEKWSSRE